MKRQSRHRSRRAGLSTLLLVGLGTLLTLLSAGALWSWLDGAAARNGADRPDISLDPKAPGRVVASATTVDLGRVPFDQMAEARYELTNTGGNDVRLVGKPSVKTLEGC